MRAQRIEPHKITKPIQLLSAWLVGLVITNSLFLATALKLPQDSWVVATLVVAAVINVPLFLGALFVLQTKFRAELQEDSFYSEYLSKKDATRIKVERISQARKNKEPDGEIENSTTSGDSASAGWSGWRVALNQLHPQFKGVRSALKEAKIPLTEIFGEHAIGLPGKWIIAINERLPFENVRLLLRTLSDFEFDGFQFWLPLPEAEENEDVYIGAYGAGSFVPFSEELFELLAGDIEPVDLNFFCRMNRVLKK